jgi:hypothetical protein
MISTNFAKALLATDNDIDRLKQTPSDLTIILDVSGSMQSAIDSLKTTLTGLSAILSLAGIENILLISYSDYDAGSPDGKNRRVLYSLYDTTDKVIAHLSTLKASVIGSGGSGEEALITALYYYLSLTNTPQHVIILTDASPHPDCNNNNKKNLHSDRQREIDFLSSHQLGVNFSDVMKLVEERGDRVGAIVSSNNLQWLSTLASDSKSNFALHNSRGFSNGTFLELFLGTLQSFMGGAATLPPASKFYGCKEGTELTTSLIPKDMVVSANPNEKEFDSYTKCYNYLLEIIKKDPTSCKYFPDFFCAKFFELMQALDKQEDWETFRRKVGDNRNQELEAFIQKRTCNTTKLTEKLKSYFDTLPANLSEYFMNLYLRRNNITPPESNEIVTNQLWLIYKGEYFPHSAFRDLLCKYFSYDGHKQFSERIKGYDVVTYQEMIDLKRIGFPVNTLAESINLMNLVFSAMTNFQTLPPAFSCAIWCFADMDRELPRVLSLMTSNFVKDHYKSYLSWILEDTIPEEIPGWWCSQLTLAILKRAIGKLVASPEKIFKRIEFLSLLLSMKKHNNTYLDYQLKVSTLTKKETMFVHKCKARGVYVPDNLIKGDGTCILCTFICDELDDYGQPDEHAGKILHDTDKGGLSDSFVTDNVSTESSHVFKCFDCKARYGVRSNRTQTAPRCFFCRNSVAKQRGEVSYKLTCKECNLVNIYAREISDWTCSNCSRKDLSQSVVVTNENKLIRLFDLIGSNINVRFQVSKLLNVDSDFLKEFIAQGAKIDTPTNKELMYGDIDKLIAVMKYSGPSVSLTKELLYEIITPEIKDTNKVIEITNVDKLISDLENTKQIITHDFCDIGTCSNPYMLLKDLHSLCNNCTFKTCHNCAQRLLKIEPGKIYPSRRLRCPGCSQNIQSRVLQLPGIKTKVLELASSFAKVGYCCGVGCKTRAIGLEENHNACGTDNNDDNVTDFRCGGCLSIYEKLLINEAKQANFIENSEDDIKKVLEAYPKGTVFRTCPGCNLYSTRDASGGSCAHMNCKRCNIHWCWVCRDRFDSSSECYAHMDAMEDEDEFHTDPYEITSSTILVPHRDDRIST